MRSQTHSPSSIPWKWLAPLVSLSEGTSSLSLEWCALRPCLGWLLPVSNSIPSPYAASPSRGLPSSLYLKGLGPNPLSRSLFIPLTCFLSLLNYHYLRVLNLFESLYCLFSASLEHQVPKSEDFVLDIALNLIFSAMCGDWSGHN